MCMAVADGSLSCKVRGKNKNYVYFQFNYCTCSHSTNGLRRGGRSCFYFWHQAPCDALKTWGWRRKPAPLQTERINSRTKSFTSYLQTVCVLHSCKAISLGWHWDKRTPSPVKGHTRSPGCPLLPVSVHSSVWQTKRRGSRAETRGAGGGENS